jgi:hypothetical protein
MRIIFYLIAALWGLSFWFMPTHDPDFGWHLFGGGWVVNNSDVPRVDLINTYGGFWVDYHWLAQVIFYKLYNLIGLDGLRYSFGLFMMIFAIFMARLIENNSSRRIPYIILSSVFLLLGSCIKETASIRPHVIGLLLLVISLLFLSNPKKIKLELITLILLAVLGSNIHVYWILIPFLWFFYRVLPRYTNHSSDSAWYVWGGFFAICAAGFISPYGIFSTETDPLAMFANYAVIFDYVGMSGDFGRLIKEFQPGLYIIGPVSFVALLFIVVLSATSTKGFVLRHFNSFGSSIVGVIMLIKAIKFASIFGVFAIPIFSRLFPVFIFRRLCMPLRLVRRLEPIIGFCVIIFLAQKVYFDAPINNDTSPYMEDEVPLKACAAIESLGLMPSHGRSHVRVMTYFDDGGWCRWSAYEKNPQFDMRVTNDGRTQLIPAEHFKEHSDLYALRNNWAQTLDRSLPDVVLVRKNQALAQYLVRAQSAWKLTYQDNVFALFVPIKVS